MFKFLSTSLLQEICAIFTSDRGNLIDIRFIITYCYLQMVKTTLEIQYFIHF